VLTAEVYRSKILFTDPNFRSAQ